ncbi:MAG: hypothetical protein HYV18_00150 [Gammaproteobacteria bacterium]|nr:hypothetical protein [Gammaproteobacteria bacterium]
MTMGTAEAISDMAQDSYSVFFTGRLRADTSESLLLARLRHLFPHAPDDRLMHFFSGARLRLAHGEPLDEAERLAQALGEHGLECEVERDPAPAELPPDAAPKPPLHAQPAPHLRAERPAAMPAHAAPRRPPPDEDALTPWERRGLQAGALAIAGLFLLALALAWRGYRLDSALGRESHDIPANCSSGVTWNPLGFRSGYVLKCAAADDDGRYRLRAQCRGPDSLEVALALFDPQGAPRAPAWRPVPAGMPGAGAAAGYLPIQYAVDGASPRPILLFASAAEPNAGLLDGSSRRALIEMLGASSLDFAEVFPGQRFSFDLAPAAWYVQHFLSGCRALEPPAGG